MLHAYRYLSRDLLSSRALVCCGTERRRSECMSPVLPAYIQDMYQKHRRAEGINFRYTFDSAQRKKERGRPRLCSSCRY